MVLNRDFWVGAGVAGFALFLLVVLIPLAVATPKSVQAIVLSPVFWPDILGIVLGIGGLALAIFAWVKPAKQTEALESPQRTLNLVFLFILMPVFVVAIPVLGMVLASMLAFLAMIIIIRPQRRRVAALLTALILPLALYAFFYHVAGVAIPQGQLVTLP